MQSAYVGGNFNNGLNDGLFYWNCRNGSSNSNWNIGARHLINKVKNNKKLLHASHFPWLLPKIRPNWGPFSKKLKNGEVNKNKINGQMINV